jgi:hypothetical protein
MIPTFTIQPGAPTAGSWAVRAQIVAGTCVCAGATAFLYAVNPTQHAVYPQCMLYNMTGIYCAGCGATRAAYALLHGRVFDALHDNALFVAALPVVLYLMVTHLLAAWRVNAWPPVHVEGSTWRRVLGAVILMLGFMALRNLPGVPFDWLKPLAT